MSEGHASHKRPMTIALALIALCVTNGGRLDAIPSPEQHEMSGTVQRVERETITILIPGESKPVVFAWNKDTKFVRDGAFTTADALRLNTQVRIRCSHPIFGSKPLLYRVAWRSSPNVKGE